MKKDLRDAVLVALAVTLAGVALGLLWLWLAPKVPLIADDKAVFLKDTEGEEAIGGDGTFILLALGLGALSAAAVFLFRKGGSPWSSAWRRAARSVVWLAARHLARPDQDVVAPAKAAGQGRLQRPAEARAKGALLVWPMAAMVVHLGLTAPSGPGTGAEGYPGQDRTGGRPRGPVSSRTGARTGSGRRLQARPGQDQAAQARPDFGRSRPENPPVARPAEDPSGGDHPSAGDRPTEGDDPRD